jgi:phospholipid/cholesterol/gamma-HCH transport system substrate-binding protein
MSATLRPNLVVRAVLLIAAALAVTVILLGGGSKAYVLNLEMSDASGLRPGSQVLLGGVAIGTVHSLSLSAHNVVIADLHINPRQARVGRGVRASIVAANLLGEEYVALNPGDTRAPLPSGTTLPESATILPTDLDQIADVLDGATRARLAILLDETGTAVAGRQSDVSAVLRQLPVSLSAATRMLTVMVADNHTLGDVVDHSESFISRIDESHAQLSQVIDSASGAATTLARRASDLRQAIQGAPQTLETMQALLRSLDVTASDLTPATAEIAAAAPPLHQLLSRIGPFTRSGVPTLNDAASVAPILTRLAVRATPTVKLAVPTAASLQKIATLAAPLSTWVGLSAPQIFDTISGWTRSVENRDGVGHVFNGDVYLDPTIILSAADHGASAAQKCENLLDIRSSAVLRTIDALHSAAVAQVAGCSTPSRVSRAGSKTEQPTRPAPSSNAPSPSSNPAAGALPQAGNGLKTLLGGVLDGVKATVGGTLSHVGSSLSSGAAQTGPSLSGLLNYLLGK